MGKGNGEGREGGRKGRSREKCIVEGRWKRGSKGRWAGSSTQEKETLNYSRRERRQGKGVGRLEETGALGKGKHTRAGR